MLSLLTLQAEIDRLVRRNLVFYRMRQSFHDAMQVDIMKLAGQFGLIGVKEHRVNKPPGFIDVAWLNEHREVVLAIEIDSSLRSKSIEKLANLPRSVERIWLCYSPSEIDIYEYEQLINGLVMKYELRFQRNRQKQREF